MGEQVGYQIDAPTTSLEVFRLLYKISCASAVTTPKTAARSALSDQFITHQ
jgi:hypothetical protein